MHLPRLAARLRQRLHSALSDAHAWLHRWHHRRALLAGMRVDVERNRRPVKE